MTKFHVVHGKHNSYAPSGLHKAKILTLKVFIKELLFSVFSVLNFCGSVDQCFIFAALTNKFLRHLISVFEFSLIPARVFFCPSQPILCHLYAKNNFQKLIIPIGCAGFDGLPS